MKVKIGKLYKHRYLENYSCVVLAETDKGWKVKVIITSANVRKKAKEKIQCFFKIDFNDEKGLWIEN